MGDPRKPCLRERIGAAVNAQDLGEDIEIERLKHVDRIGALGWAAGKGLKPRLSSLLWRLRYGMDKRCRHEASIVLAAWLCSKDEVRNKWNLSSPTELLVRFSTIVLIEWEHEACAACGGKGTVPMNADQENPIGWRSYCSHCHGSGRRVLSHGERVSLLGLTFTVYEKRWQRRFSQAHRWMRDVESVLSGHLRFRLS